MCSLNRICSTETQAPEERITVTRGRGRVSGIQTQTDTHTHTHTHTHTVQHGQVAGGLQDGYGGIAGSPDPEAQAQPSLPRISSKEILRRLSGISVGSMSSMGTETEEFEAIAEVCVVCEYLCAV